jgi:hypothetical protein
MGFDVRLLIHTPSSIAARKGGMNIIGYMPPMRTPELTAPIDPG